MEFFSPGRLSLLSLVPIMLAVYLAALRRRARYAHRFSELGVPGSAVSRGRQWRRHAAVALALLAVSSCVVAFARPTGKVQVPRERATVVVMIDVSLSMMATDVDPADPAPARIVLLSDGKRTTGRPVQDAAEAAKEQKTPVYTITFGTDAGSFELDGVRQSVPPDRAEMRELSQITGGQAYTAESAGELKNVYKDIGSSVGVETVDREVTDRFAGIAMLLALAAAAATAASGVRFP
jgi:hypothetical protein